MKRKLIQLAKKTLVISIPKSFVQRYNLKKGEEIEIEEQGNKIILKTDKEFKTNKSIIDISDLNKSLIWNYLLSIYRNGTNEIKIIFNNRETFDKKTNQKIKTMDLLHKIAERLIGMEIIKQSSNHCIFKEVSGIKEEEFDNMFRRIFFSLINLSNDSLEAIKKEDKETLESIFKYTDVNINKLTDFCMRILNKKGHKNPDKTALYYHILSQLEEIGDSYIFISELISQGMKIRHKVIKIYEETNELLLLFHSTFYNPKKEKIIELHNKRFKTKREIDELYEKVSSKETMVLVSLKLITNLIMQAINSKISLEESSSL